MATLSEEAKSYEPATTKNIAELDIVETSWPVETREGTDQNGQPYSFKVVVKDGQDYRVPSSVLVNLKSVLAKKPDLQKFSVSKIGEGMSTKYTVIPLL